MSACQASLGLDNKSNNGENLDISMQIEATRKNGRILLLEFKSSSWEFFYQQRDTRDKFTDAEMMRRRGAMKNPNVKCIQSNLERAESVSVTRQSIRTSKPAPDSRTVVGVPLRVQPEHVLFFEPDLNLNEQLGQCPDQ